MPEENPAQKERQAIVLWLRKKRDERKALGDKLERAHDREENLWPEHLLISEMLNDIAGWIERGDHRSERRTSEEGST